MPGHNFVYDHGRADWEIADPGTGKPLDHTRSGTINIAITSGSETNTLARPVYVGQELLLFVKSFGSGTRAITCNHDILPTAGADVITFNAALQFVLLKAVRRSTNLLHWHAVITTAASIA